MKMESLEATGHPTAGRTKHAESVARARFATMRWHDTLIRRVADLVDAMTDRETEISMLMSRFNAPTRAKGQYQLRACWKTPEKDVAVFGASSIRWVDYPRNSQSGAPKDTVMPPPSLAARRFADEFVEIQLETFGKIKALERERIELRKAAMRVYEVLQRLADKIGAVDGRLPPRPQIVNLDLGVSEARDDLVRYGQALLMTLQRRLQLLDEQLDADIKQLNAISRWRNGTIIARWEIRRHRRELLTGPSGPWFFTLSFSGARKSTRVSTDRGNVITRELIRTTYNSQHQEAYLAHAKAIEASRTIRNEICDGLVEAHTVLADALSEELV